MHDNTVSSDVSKAGETSVRAPVVCLDPTARQKTRIYDGQKGNGVSPINYCEIRSGWTVLGRDVRSFSVLRTLRCSVGTDRGRQVISGFQASWIDSHNWP